ncbi:MAG TPA: alpha-L-arabinofuranosidase C-terminal domain-containing protein [Bacteroidales bacterium]|nr:alpha-L-arabinofuranosidase C-terminal domain-containing protein [Bacteroidales bacterium]
MKKTLIISVLLLTRFLTYGQNSVSMLVDGSSAQYTISKHIYGHFSEHLGRCIYDGYWVDPKLNVPKQDRIRLDIVEALKAIKIPNLRWPGGCFADEYHWMDGIGPREQRPSMINTNWGNVTEDNSFGTHEFLELCKLLETEPFIVGNVGSGSVEEMSNWVEYLNFDGMSPMTNLRKANGRAEPWGVKFFGIGNENWGCGGNMTPEYYTDQYKRYATYTKNYPNASLNKIACGPNSTNYEWTETLMSSLFAGGRRANVWGIDLHYYTRPPRNQAPAQGAPAAAQPATPAPSLASATNFTEETYFLTMQNALRMEELITRHDEIMTKYDPAKNVALVIGEWGIWTDPEPGTNPRFLYQQNSMRDAIIAATHLNIFNNHCDRVKMAQLAQTINVLQALILTEGEKIILTPTYHVFDMYKVHHDATMIPVKFFSPDYELGNQSLPAINVSASRDKNGEVHISLVNIDPNKSYTVNTTLNEVKWSTVSGEILTSAKLTDINTFSSPGNIVKTKYNGAKKQGDMLTVTLPGKSVVMLTLK